MADQPEGEDGNSYQWSVVDSSARSTKAKEEDDDDVPASAAKDPTGKHPPPAAAVAPPRPASTEGSELEEDEDRRGDGPGDNHQSSAEQNLLSSKWEDSFTRLLAFKAKHGHVLVPNRYREDPQLGSWVSTQRRQYKILISGTGTPTAMTADRARRLEAIGFRWSTTDPRHVPWHQRYEELGEFVKKYGHSQVPIGWEENVQLSNWVSTQRQEFKLMQKGRKTRLTRDRIDQLNKLNFVWEAQRGGPRRSKRATVCVPEKPTPIDMTGPVLTGRRGSEVTQATASTQDERSASQPHEAHISDPGESARILSAEALLAARNLETHASRATRSYRASLASAAAGLAADPQEAAVAAAMARLSDLRHPPDVAGLGLVGAPAPPPSSWQVMPHGGFQQESSSLISSLGIFPIATPIPIAAAGYQLGMIPSGLVQGATVSSGILPPPLVASSSRTSKRRRSKKHRRKKKKRRKGLEQSIREEESSSSSSSDSSSEESEG